MEPKLFDEEELVFLREENARLWLFVSYLFVITCLVSLALMVVFVFKSFLRRTKDSMSPQFIEYGEPNKKPIPLVKIPQQKLVPPPVLKKIASPPTTQKIVPPVQQIPPPSPQQQQTQTTAVRA